MNLLHLIAAISKSRIFSQFFGYLFFEKPKTSFVLKCTKPDIIKSYQILTYGVIRNALLETWIKTWVIEAMVAKFLIKFPTFCQRNYQSKHGNLGSQRNRLDETNIAVREHFYWMSFGLPNLSLVKISTNTL